MYHLQIHNQTYKIYMKYIIPSIIIVAFIAWGGYALFKKVPVSSQVKVFVGTNTFGTDTGTASVSATSSPDIIAIKTNQQKHMINLDTNYGVITFETYDVDAPKTVENFVTLANKGYYNGLTFHRVIPGFMIQGGDPTGNGTGGPGYSFADELNPATPSYKAGYKKGVVAMANSGPNTNGSQFFIMTEDYPLPNNYTIFGKVVSGQDVVDTISKAKTGAQDKPATPVIMKTVTVK